MVGKIWNAFNFFAIFIHKVYGKLLTGKLKDKNIDMEFDWLCGLGM